MRENRSSGLMRGGKTTVIGSASQPVSSRLLYNRVNAESMASAEPTRGEAW